MRILDVCCGGGGAARGYLRAGAGIVVGVDSDAGMRGDFSRAVGDRGIFLHEDALEVLQDTSFLQEFDLIHISPPCFAAGTPVLTRRGSVSIEDVREGDEVWTHMNRWRRVTATMSRESSRVQVGPITTTSDHPFLALRKASTRTLYSPSEGRLPRGRRPSSHSAEWVPAARLQGLFLASPLSVTDAGEASWPCDPWLAGRYTADGWTGRDGVMIAVGSPKRAEFDLECGELPWRKQLSGRNCWRYTLADHEMGTWLRAEFGHGAANKTLPVWLLHASEKDRTRFLAGYLAGDGSVTANGWCANTVSAHLASQLRLLALGLGYAAQARAVRTPDVTIIEGRTVSQRDYWSVGINRDGGRYGIRKDGMYWFKQRKPVTDAGHGTVYDITVDEDHSFVAWGYVVHNCQRWSRMANCRPGLSEEYPDLITPSLPLLEASDVPYVVENIVSRGTRALLPGAVMLCGAMFGLRLYRHRLFRSGGWELTAPEKPAAWAVPPGATARSVRPNPHCGWTHPVAAARAGHWVPGKYVSVSGHERRAVVNEAMQIDWMADREHVKEAIPPQFTQWVGTLFRVAAW